MLKIEEAFIAQESTHLARGIETIGRLQLRSGGAASPSHSWSLCLLPCP